MSLSALSGYLSLTQIYLNKFRTYEELWKEKSYEKTANDAGISDKVDDLDRYPGVMLELYDVDLERDSFRFGCEKS